MKDIEWKSAFSGRFVYIRSFKGNPAWVCFTETSLDEATMRSIAAEMAVSETAFYR
ncbi:hypothetical protein HND97_16770 [Vibrio cholerae]|nr:hypothetical protein HND97_16770 [Vibrio cholerae]